VNKWELILVLSAVAAVAAAIGLAVAEMGVSAADQPRVQAAVEAEGGALVARFKVLQGRIGGLMLQIGGGEPRPADSCVRYHEVAAVVTQTLTRTVTTTTATATTTTTTTQTTVTSLSDATACPPSGSLVGANFQPYCTAAPVGGYPQTAGPKVVLTEDASWQMGYLVLGRVPPDHDCVYARFEFWTGGRADGADAVWFGIYDDPITSGDYFDLQNTAREDIVTGGYHFTIDEYIGNWGNPSGSRIAFTKSTQDNGPPIAGAAVPPSFIVDGQWHTVEIRLCVDDGSGAVRAQMSVRSPYGAFSFSAVDTVPQPNALARAGYFYIGGRTGGSSNWHLVRNVYVAFYRNVTQTVTRTVTTTTTTVTTSTAVYTSTVPAGVPEYYQGQSGICRWSLGLAPGAYDYTLYAYSQDGRQIVVARGRLYVR